MALKDEKIPYEILVRFGDDGQPKGAHVLYRRVVTLDDEILKDEVLAAQPLDLEGFPTSEIMTDAARDALAKVAVLEAEVLSVTEQLNTANETIQNLQKNGLSSS